MPRLAPSSPATTVSTLVRLLRRGAVIAAFCVGVAALLTAMDPHTRFLSALLYSLLIGACCWLFTQVGLATASSWLSRRCDDPWLAQGWPGWRWALVIIPVATMIGATLGSALADALSGRASRWPLFSQLDGGLGVLVVSLITAGSITYFFFSRERLAATLAQAAAAERLAAETQLTLLQSQLEPHMLFNTLANLRVLIGLDPPRAQAMLDRLIAFLRATLTASRSSTHPLAAEFDRLADYLALIAVRMGPRLEVVLDLPEALRELPVPPLLLQPLVENGVLHGIEPKLGGGRIEVRAARDGDRLVLTVRDTGVGIGHGPASGGTGLGLRMVRERLQALYGGAAALQVEPAADGGTVARLTLPWPLAAPPPPRT